ncbi:MAG: prolyl oligopeptidase family serine peptidase [Actinomycetota bacterium]
MALTLGMAPGHQKTSKPASRRLRPRLPARASTGGILAAVLSILTLPVLPARAIPPATSAGPAASAPAPNADAVLSPAQPEQPESEDETSAPSRLTVRRVPGKDWWGHPTGIFREATYDRGEWIYSNGIFQAQGANADGLHRDEYFAAVNPVPEDAFPAVPPQGDLYRAATYDLFGTHRWTHNGDYQLPTDKTQWPDFTADLAVLRLSADHANLFMRLEFTSMPRPDAQIATIAFTHAGDKMDAKPWPANAGVKSPWQTAVTLWGTGGQVDTAGGTKPLKEIGGEVSTPSSRGSYLVDARVPLRLLPPSPWVLRGGSGLNDPASPGKYWTVPAGPATQTTPGTGSPTAPGSNVWDLLFAKDDPWTFDERRQADDLAAGDVTGDFETVDLALLRSWASKPAAVRTGDLSRFFSSRLFSGDGIKRGYAGISPFAPPGYGPPLPDPGVNVNYFYTGRLQPYYMHVPAAYAASDKAFPLIVYLHGFTGLPDEPFHNPLGLVKKADEEGYLFASALGRGDYFYRGEGDVDVQEVLADVKVHYRVDPDRVYLMGHSMGGYGTNNMGTHHPDLFAAIAPAQGTDSIALHANLRNLPWLEMTSDEDLDGMAQSANSMYSELSAHGYDATLIEYRMKIHEYSSIYDTLPRLFRFFASHRRNLNPAIVTYEKLPGEDRPDLPVAYDRLVYDGAYWVSRMCTAAGPGEYGSSVEAESFGIPHTPLDPPKATRTDESVDEGGPSGRTAAQLKQTVPAYGHAAPAENRARLSMVALAAVTLDLGRMGLYVSRKLVLDTTNRGVESSGGDKTTRTTLEPGVADRATGEFRVSVDGNPAASIKATGGNLQIDVPLGTHQLTIEPMPAVLGSTAGSTLPATGSTPIGLGVALAGCAALLWKLRGTRGPGGVARLVGLR